VVERPFAGTVSSVADRIWSVMAALRVDILDDVHHIKRNGKAGASTAVIWGRLDWSYRGDSWGRRSFQLP
jgi:hypothetical protein